MLNREKLFPGTEQEEQLQMIIDLLGYPENEDKDLLKKIADESLGHN